MVTLYEIIEVPAMMPVTKPVLPTVATAVLLLDQVPDGVTLLSNVFTFSHIASVPLIAATTGAGFTVIVELTEATQPNPLVTVYVMIEVPAERPVTTPEPLIVATANVLLAHVPLVVELLNVDVVPAHNVAVPDIAATVGNGLTVTLVVTVVLQPKPLVTVYEIVVLPVATVATTPPVPMVATAVLELSQTPPETLLVSAPVAPIHILVEPDIDDTVGVAFTVTIAVALFTQPRPSVKV